jgi:excinuclease UvrABC nuclease subunit
MIYPPTISSSETEGPRAPTRQWLLENGWRSPDVYYDDECDAIPDSPGVYAVTLQWYEERKPRFEIAYIGMSMRLKTRVTYRHEACVALDDECDGPKYVLRFFRRADASDVRQLELDLIRGFQPRLNIIGTKTALRRSR